MEASALARRAPLGTLKPGRVSPMRAVPEHIERPEYMFHDGPERVTASEIKSPETIAKIREAGRIAAGAIEAVGAAIAPGVTTEELDRIGHEFLIAHDAVVEALRVGLDDASDDVDLAAWADGLDASHHGVLRALEDGDIINIDITAYKDGVHGDTCAMFEVGTVDEESHLLIERTKNAMMRGIKAVGPGREINVIGRVIEAYAKRFDYGVVRDYTGHGVGEAFHSGLIVPHYDAAPAYDTVMEPGMVFTIEPMLTLGTIEWEQWDDDWTIVTADRSRTAQFEHTIVVTEDGAEILTLP